MIREKYPEEKPVALRAADDFSTIRARLKELRRERTLQSSDTEDGAVLGPRTYQGSTESETEPESHRLARPVRQRLFG
jgi:hypothetical protein